MNMKEQLRAVAKEYARQFGKIIGIEPDYWVGGDISLGVCAYGDYFFNLDDMQIVVDNIDKWVKKYGTIEKVGDEVIGWHEWMTEHEFRIGLYAWLDDRIPTRHSVELNKIYRQIEVLKEIVELYPSHTVGNVIMQLEARTKELSKTKEPKDQ